MSIVADGRKVSPFLRKVKYIRFQLFEGLVLRTVVVNIYIRLTLGVHFLANFYFQKSLSHNSGHTGPNPHTLVKSTLYLIEVAVAEPGDGLRLPVRQRWVEGDHVGGS